MSAKKYASKEEAYASRRRYDALRRERMRESREDFLRRRQTYRDHSNGAVYLKKTALPPQKPVGVIHQVHRRIPPPLAGSIAWGLLYGAVTR